MTTLTSDKHVANLSDALVITPDGLHHYAVLVDHMPDLSRFDPLRDKIPFYIPLCLLCDAYDAAKGFYDFTYPELRYTEDDVQHGSPTCASCCSA